MSRPLIKLEQYHLHYGAQVIYEALDLQIHKGDRLCITGRNGVGKPTLLKSLYGSVDPDSGSRWVADGTIIAGLEQDLPITAATGDESGAGTVYRLVASGMRGVGGDLARYRDLANHSGADLQELEQLQSRIEAADGWNLQNRIEQVLSQFGLDGDKYVTELSGGWRRRVEVARALVSEPDLLLLDEPTNHLDIPAIAWLEEFIRSFSGAIVLISHDRAFLRAVSNRFAEIDRGQVIMWDGDYDSFLNFREQQLATESRQSALFDKRLAQEETWIRQGIKARRTRNEGRVRALEAMRDQRSQRRNIEKSAKLEVDKGDLSGKMVVQLHQVEFAWDQQKLIDDFNCTIVRGDKIGLIGPNGIGKSTLLKIITGALAPQKGKVVLGTKLQIGYFDQRRELLDLDKSALDNIAGGRDSIEINGRTRHIYSYLQDFLFSGERARTPIKSLSGGERNRILLAKLFSQPCNLLIMDEPTNDLDVETLELLEDLLVEYAGTLLLVSHDREFLDNVVTSTIAFEGNGVLNEYVGGYSDWIRQGGQWPQNSSLADVNSATPAQKNSGSEKNPVVKAKSRKLSYKLQLELDQLPAEIEMLEQEIEALNNETTAPEFYRQDSKVVADRLKQMADKQDLLHRRYQRWEELENEK